MSNEVFTREEITLQDGTIVELRPLVVFYKRKFLAIWSDHVTALNEDIKKAAEAAENDEAFNLNDKDLNERQYDTYLKLCALALGDEVKGERTEKQFKEYLEKTLDDPTIYKILKVCGGLDLESNSPN